MVMGTSLVALAMVAAGGASESAEPISYQVKVLTIEGTQWRSSSFHRMRPVARQGTSTIWTADRALADSLAKEARSSSTSPRVLATANSSVAKKQDQHYVSHLERVSDGPVNQASHVTYVPEVATLPEGFQAAVTGRRIDQGILANVAIEDAYVVRIEDVSLPETIKHATRPICETGIACPVEFARKLMQVATGGDADASSTRVSGQIQLPEIAKGKAEGEWLVPSDSILLVSLGIHTTADARGMAVTQERLAIVDFDATPIRPISTEAFGEAQTGFIPPTPFVAGEPMPIALANLPQATPPSRSLPRSIDVDGQEIDLPPLPESVASADLNQIEPGSKLASPQMQIRGATADAALARTSFDAIPTPAAPSAMTVGVFTSMSNTLVEFSEKLMQRLPEYEMDIDVSSDGRTCQVSFRDDTIARAGKEPACPPEPRCDNGKEADGNVALSTFLGKLALPMASMKVGEVRDLPIVSGGEKAVSSVDCPDCDECLKEKDASCPVGKDRLASVFEMVVNKTVGGAPKPMAASVDLRSALTTPGKAQTSIVPLSADFALEIKATVIPIPTAGSKVDKAAETVAYHPRRVEELLQAADGLSRAADEWNRFWFLDRPGDLKFKKAEDASKP